MSGLPVLCGLLVFATIGGVEAAPEIPDVGDGQRAFTVVNLCSQTIRVGSTGGRITFRSDLNPFDKSNCDNRGPSAVFNPGPNGIGCYWKLPPKSDGNNGDKERELSTGEWARYTFFETTTAVRWSGTVWASTGCNEMEGCVTGVCHNGVGGDHVCPAYIGPGGPTTKAEFTLGHLTDDYYDVSNIDGVNLPVEIRPDKPIYSAGTSNHALYQCGNPGGASSETGLSECDWNFETTIDGIEEDLSRYLRMVLPNNTASPISCEGDLDCMPDDICGMHPRRWANGAFMGGVEDGSCGKHIGWVTAGGACASGWYEGQFPDSFPYYCGQALQYGVRATLYGCRGDGQGNNQYAHSGYTPKAESSACGCPDWHDMGFNAPPVSECQSHNPEWAEHVLPFTKQIKRACPTAYTFPYDDQTSTFHCNDFDGTRDTNTQSYTITFCPGSTEGNMFP